MTRSLEVPTKPAEGPKEPWAQPQKPKPSWRKWAVTATIGIGLLLIAGIVYLNLHWPLRREAVTADLAEAMSSNVQMHNFREIRFPHPGFIAEGVTFTPGEQNSSPLLITIQKLTVETSWLRLFFRHVADMRAEGMHVTVPPIGTVSRGRKGHSDTVVDTFQADGAILDFQRRERGRQPVRFSIHRFTIHRLGGKGAMQFQTALLNPTPPGEVSSTGQLGPWNEADPGQTPISGKYSFQQANLGVFEGIGGVLSSSGQFKGPLKAMVVEGGTNMPNFETRGHHPVRLVTDFRALVNGFNGDVTLQKVQAHFWNTTVASAGSIAGKPHQKGKTAGLDLLVNHGRIQDILFLFVTEARAPLAGTVGLRAHVMIPPGDRAFLKKLELQADFGIDGARFTSPDTQQSIANLSERARGEKKDDDKDEKKNEDKDRRLDANHDRFEKNPDGENILSDLKGHVVLKDGTANFSGLSFAVPGAVAQMNGTYDLISEKINLHGELQIQTKPSEATSGPQSFLLKALNPFLKNDHPGAWIPISITGTYSNPSYKVTGKPK